MERDFQKDRVYKWSHARFGVTSINSKPELSVEQCIALVADICKNYGISPCQLIFKDGYQAQASFYSPMTKTIFLYSWGRKRWILIHEIAHYIHHIKNCSGASHGSEYFSIFSYLLSQYCGLPLHEIFHKASKYGIVSSKHYPTFIEGTAPNPTLVF